MTAFRAHFARSPRFVMGLCGVPITTQVLDFAGLVMGVTGVMGFPAHVWARTPAPTCGRASTQARSPHHTRHTHHKMSQINNLGCDGYPSHPLQTHHNAAETAEAEHLAAFARRLGVNRSTVTRAAQAGRLVLAADGRVLVQASLARWHATRGGRLDLAERHAQARGHAVAGVAGTATPPAAAPGGPTGGDQDAGDTSAPPEGSRAFWEAEKLRWQNTQLLLSLDLQSGARIPRGALQREAHGLGATLRATVERLIDQTAPRLAAAATEADRRRLLAAEMAAARRLVRREFAAALRRLRPEQLGTTALRLDATPDTPEQAA